MILPFLFWFRLLFSGSKFQYLCLTRGQGENGGNRTPPPRGAVALTVNLVERAMAATLHDDVVMTGLDELHGLWLLWAPAGGGGVVRLHRFACAPAWLWLSQASAG